MFTLALCWINSKYETKYEMMFILTFILDLHLLDVAMEYFG